MSDLIKANLKELSQELNVIQTKKKEIAKKFDIDAKSKILDEIKLLKDKTKLIVWNIYLSIRLKKLIKILKCLRLKSEMNIKELSKVTRLNISK